LCAAPHSKWSAERSASSPYSSSEVSSEEGASKSLTEQDEEVEDEEEAEESRKSATDGLKGVWLGLGLGLMVGVGCWTESWELGRSRLMEDSVLLAEVEVEFEVEGRDLEMRGEDLVIEAGILSFFAVRRPERRRTVVFVIVVNVLFRTLFGRGRRRFETLYQVAVGGQGGKTRDKEMGFRMLSISYEREQDVDKEMCKDERTHG
jgi:hypothetical protein